jgi:hypothetical protein
MTLSPLLPAVAPRVSRTLTSVFVCVFGMAVTGSTQSFGDNPQQTLRIAAHLATFEARQMSVAAAVPGFGGVFRDVDGVLAIYLTDLSKKDRARAAIESAFGAAVVRSAGLRFLKAGHRFEDLLQYHAMVQPALSMRGVTFTDLDEAHNRVTVGVESETHARDLEVELLRSGVPADALHVTVTGPIHMLATLRDKIRPVVGGLQINFSTSYVCTNGFMAVRAGVRGFVTNSHCTGGQGRVSSTVYYQPSRSISSSRIGVETVDPAFWSGGVCPAGNVCRYSDSAFVKLDSAVSYSRGRIARTNGLGSLTINTTYPRFRIGSEASSPLAGETLNKMGRTTGWSRGTVQNTCVSIGASGTNLRYICQDLVAAKVGPGDSGSPVFKVITSPVRVKLYGILWGGNSTGTLFVFSRLSNIQKELGTLATCDTSLAGC